MHDVEDRHDSFLVVDAVDDAIGASSCTVPIVEGSSQPFADSLWTVEQRTDDELVRSECNRSGEVLRKLPPGCGSDAERVPGRIASHACCRRRSSIARVSSASDSPSPRASSASAAARRRTVSGSDKIAMVSSSVSRSSVATSTAEGLPCTVTVTRSCWELTRLTSSDRCAFTSASDRIAESNRHRTDA